MITIDGHDSTILSTVGNIESFIYYNNSVDTFPSIVIETIPKLVVRNITIESFISYYNDGGAMSFSGDIDLSLFAITFKDDYSIFSGGALSINHNTYYSVISHCVFEDCYSSGMIMIIIITIIYSYCLTFLVTYLYLLKLHIVIYLSTFYVYISIE